MSTPTPGAGGPLRALQMVGGAMSAAVVFVNLALFFVLPHDATPQLVSAAILLAAGVAVFLVTRVVTGRVRPIPPTTPDDQATRLAAARFSSLVFTRYALAEVPALLGVVLAFSLEPSTWFTSLIGLVVSAPLLLLAWPSTTSVETVQGLLEGEGARTSLSRYMSGQR